MGTSVVLYYLGILFKVFQELIERVQIQNQSSRRCAAPTVSRNMCSIWSWISELWSGFSLTCRTSTTFSFFTSSHQLLVKYGQEAVWKLGLAFQNRGSRGKKKPPSAESEQGCEPREALLRVVTGSFVCLHSGSGMWTRMWGVSWFPSLSGCFYCCPLPCPGRHATGSDPWLSTACHVQRFRLSRAGMTPSTPIWVRPMAASRGPHTLPATRPAHLWSKHSRPRFPLSALSPSIPPSPGLLSCLPLLCSYRQKKTTSTGVHFSPWLRVHRKAHTVSVGGQHETDV